MDKALKAILTGMTAADFLANTKRVVQAILVWNECLILLLNKALEKENYLVRKVSIFLYKRLFYGYVAISDLSRAIEYLHKAISITKEIGDKNGEASCYENLGIVFHSAGEYAKAEEYLHKALHITKEIGDKNGEASCYGNLGVVFQSVGEYAKAKEYLHKALHIKKEIGDKNGEASCYGNLGSVFQSVGEYAKAEEYLHKALHIKKEIGDKQGEASCYINLGTVFRSVSEYAKAEEYLHKALSITKEIGDKNGEASSYRNLGRVFESVGEYAKAEEYLHKALHIKKEIGNKQGEATSYLNLGTVFKSLGKYAKAEEYLHKALSITKEIGDKNGEASSYLTLGTVFKCVSEYAKAEEYLHKALSIMKEIGDKQGEASCYGNLGSVFESVSEYAKADEYLHKALHIEKEIGDKNGEAASYLKLGNVFVSVGEYAKAEEYLHKALHIEKEIGDKQGEASCYGNLGSVFRSVGEYAKAEEYLHKALHIEKEFGDKQGEASCYINLGTVFGSVGEYDKAEEYLHKALHIKKEIGNKQGEATSYLNLGSVFESLGKYAKAEEYLHKALSITKEIGDKNGEASSYLKLGSVFQSVGKYAKAEEYLHKALHINKEIGYRQKDAACYLNLGTMSLLVVKYAKAEEYFQKALQISKEAGMIKYECVLFSYLHFCSLLKGNVSEALSNLLVSIQKCEKMLNSLGSEDHRKILFFDQCATTYQSFSSLCCASGKPYEALHVVELGRARALADLMSNRYSVEKGISLNPQSFVGIEKVIKESGNSTCLYISYHCDKIFLWILKQSKPTAFREAKLCESYVGKQGKISVDHLFGNESLLRNFHVLPQEQCEDRSLFSSYAHQLIMTNESILEESLPSLRLVVDEEEESEHPEPLTLKHVYNMFTAPVSDLLEGPEIIVVPDRCLFLVPFAALRDESNKYLSDTFRLRILPSLTTLKLIQDSPAGSHSETGALIIGQPSVKNVYYKGKEWNLCPLPGAKAEAKMIARLLPGSCLLIGEQATKQAVLQRLHSVSLIHFAAHGNAERGEIALTPLDSTKGIPHEPDYLLSVAEISQVRLTAKLVVLSCCHTARGQIKAEGVVGIARAFLGSGARSVLVALWALQDRATEQFMSRFYEHLVQGESASESLHRAMKWMRNNGFSEVRQWAPFMLIGDDVSFDFGK